MIWNSKPEMYLYVCYFKEKFRVVPPVQKKTTAKNPMSSLLSAMVGVSGAGPQAAPPSPRASGKATRRGIHCSATPHSSRVQYMYCVNLWIVFFAHKHGTSG